MLRHSSYNLIFLIQGAFLCCPHNLRQFIPAREFLCCPHNLERFNLPALLLSDINAFRFIANFGIGLNLHNNRQDHRAALGFAEKVVAQLVFDRAFYAVPIVHAVIKAAVECDLALGTQLLH